MASSFSANSDSLKNSGQQKASVGEPSVSAENTDESSKITADSFLSSVMLLMVLTVFQKGVGFIRAIVVGRILPPEEMGDWGLMNSVIYTGLPLVLLSIPACFGRYCVYYQARGQLRSFLVQSTVFCGALLLLGQFIFFYFQETIATLAFGSPERGWAVVGCGLALIPFALFSFGTELLNALRRSRMTTIGNFINGITFTVVSIGLLVFFRPDAKSMLIAFSSASVVAVFFVGFQLYRSVVDLPKDSSKLPIIASWKFLLPIVGLFWINDFLVNMFYMSDRFMMMNLLVGDLDFKRYMVGNYEAGHLVPMLFSAIVLLVAKFLMPYLARAWEAGDFQTVQVQTNLSVKISIWVMAVTGLILVQISDPIFQILFKGKYPSGNEVFSLVIMFYLATGVSALVMNYFWCIGRAQWSVAALALGVLANIVGNFMLVPTYGIQGAAIATLIGAFSQVFIQIYIANRFGLPYDKGVFLIVFASGCILVDPCFWPITVPIVIGSLFVPGVLSGKDRVILRKAFRKVAEKLGVFSGSS